MAPWGDAKLLFCLVFITCCMVSLAQVPVDCCLNTSNKRIRAAKQRIVDYLRQTAGEGCSIDAMILITKHHRKLCVAPGENWVQEVVTHVDLKKYCKENNYQEKRCQGLKQE